MDLSIQNDLQLYDKRFKLQILIPFIVFIGWINSSMSQRDSAVFVQPVPISFSFFVDSGKVFRSSLDIYVFSGEDTLFFRQTINGKFQVDLVPNYYQFMFCSTLTDTLITEIITIDSTKKQKEIEIFLKLKTLLLPEIRYDLGKPVIYCYSTDDDKTFSIKIESYGDIVFTYPQFNDCWEVTSDSLGNIQCNGKSYPYLFWEATYNNPPQFSAVDFEYCVKQSDLVSFFDSVLTNIGFNDRERTDFITYWIPQMKGYPGISIHFLFQDDCNELARLEINPQPLNIFRVYMLWSPANEFLVSIPVKLPKINRDGFTVVEWGGMKIESSSTTP